MSECDVLVRCYGEKHLLFLNYIHLIGRINMQFLALIYAGEEQDDVDLETLIAQYQAFDEQAEKAGILLGGNALEAVSTATSVRVRNSKSELTDGPFAETKEQLGGYYLFECKNLDEALEWAAKIPSARYGTIEVRPVMVFDQ
jgi:hypothetical protein